jgi:hypothetical protein
MTKTLYTEEQRNKQPWIWLILVPGVFGSLVFFGLGINQQVVHGKPFGNNPMSDAGLVITSILMIVFMLGLTLLFYKMKLITEVRSDGVYFRYPPFIGKFKVFHRDEIERFEVREYKPVSEYGGHGLKTSSKKFGKAYTVYGKSGLQLYLKNGSKILIGTQRKEAIKTAMTRMMETDSSSRNME